MTQNRSFAVMQQRTEAHDSLDDFPTPPWATRAIVRLIAGKMQGVHASMPSWAAREPCANRGYMWKPLTEFFPVVHGSDIMDYGAGFAQLDYLMPGEMVPAHATFMNPPFRLAEQFIEKSFETPLWRLSAVLIRTSFLEGTGRYARLYGVRPPTLVAHFSERVVMVKGRLLDPDVPIWNAKNEKMERPTTATSYSWLVWIADVEPLPTAWIPPCRKALTRPGDYPALTARELGPAS